MSTINIGKGSSKFYSNLIKAYLKNNNEVRVVSGGLRMNLGVWVYYYASLEHVVGKPQVHYTEDERIHTTFEFTVRKGDPVKFLKSEYDGLKVKVSKHSSIKSLRSVIYNVDNVKIIAAGALCHRALFLSTFAIKYGYKLQDIHVFMTDAKRVGIEIKVYKQSLNK